MCNKSKRKANAAKANAKNAAQENGLLNKTIKRIAKTKQYTVEDIAEVVCKFILAEPYEDNLFYKENEDYKYFVFKGDQDGNGFEVCYAFFDKNDCKNNQIETLSVENCIDFRGLITTMAEFSKNPFVVLTDIYDYNNDINEERA